jgi:hypothetical protein
MLKINIVKIIQGTFYIVLFLFLLDIFNLFQTKIRVLKALLYFGVMLLPIVVLILEFKANRSLTKGFFRKITPLFVIIGILFLNPIRLLFHMQPWKTQTVKQIINNNRNHKIESQLKDIGALGYAKRTVEVYDITPYFYVILSKQLKK